MTIRVREFDEWTEFVSHVHAILTAGFHGTPITSLAFRGQGASAWPLTPSLDRALAGTGVDAETVQLQTLKEYRRRVSTDRDGPGADDLVLSHLQHFGAPTRLLDWSRSPFIAAFFALSGAPVSTDWSSVWVIDPTSQPFQDRSGLSFLDIAVAANERARAQMGCFTRLSSMYGSIDSHLAAYAGARGIPKPVAERWDIASRNASIALHELALMGTSYQTLFPDATGVARESFHLAVRSIRLSGSGGAHAPS